MSPSGTIAFASGKSVDFDIWSYDFATKQVARLTSGQNLNDQPCFSPDGNMIVYVSTQEDMIPSLWTMNADGSNKKRLTNKYYCQNPSFTRDGKSIVFAANAKEVNNIDIFKIDLSNPEQSLELLFTSEVSESSPSLSPYGTKLLFCGAGKGNDTDIKELELSTKKVTTLASHPARDVCPKYSPDGKMIAFVSYREGYNEGLYNELNTRIAAAVKAGDLNLVNKLIIELQNVEGDSEIFVMNSSGDNLRQLTFNKRSDASLCWSPCSKYLCYTSGSAEENETERLRIIEVANGDDQELAIDRSALESEIGASQLLNASWFQKVVPDWIEKKFVSKSFWGEERNPTWKAS